MKVLFFTAITLFLFMNCFSQQEKSEFNMYNLDTVETKELAVKNHEGLNWASTIHEAYYKSKKEKKPILIYFTGSDWCGPCKELDKKFFHTKKFKEIADKELILYTADYPRIKAYMNQDVIDDNNVLQERYRVSGFPTLLFVNHRGKELKISRGLSLVEHYYYIMRDVINKY